MGIVMRTVCVLLVLTMVGSCFLTPTMAAQETFGEHVVYLSAVGDDSKDGYTAQNAVATVKRAYERLDAIMINAPAGTTGTLVISGLIDLGINAFHFPAHSYPVRITGETDWDGLRYSGGNNAITSCVNFNGDTTLENMTIDLKSNHPYNYLSANGYKLELGTGLNCIANSKGAYFNVCGGAYSGTFASTDVIIRSGTWRNVYYGSYTGNVDGDAKLTMLGGSFTNNIQSSFTGDVDGDAYVLVTDTQLGANIYAAGTNSGTVRGSATVIVGSGNSGTTTIAPGMKGHITGRYTLILNGGDLTDLTVLGKSQDGVVTGGAQLVLKNGTLGQVSDFDSIVLETEGYVKLGECVQLDMEVKGESYLDLNGYTMCGALAGDGTLNGMDSSSDSYLLPTGRIDGTVSCNIAYVKATVTGEMKRYMPIADENGYTFHRYYVGITKVTLRPGSSGIGYKARFCGDATVRAMVAEFGLRMSLSDSEMILTQSRNGIELDTQREYSILLQNVDIKNYGERAVNAQAFIQLKDGTELASGTVCYSMKTILQTISANIESFSEQQLDLIRTMCAGHEAVMKQWDIDGLI